MSHDEFMDDLMKQLYDKFGKPEPQPGADETPPRNYYCAACRAWLTTEHMADCGTGLGPRPTWCFIASRHAWRDLDQGSICECTHCMRWCQCEV